MCGSVAGRPSRRPCSCAPWWQRFEAPARRGGRRTRAEGRERARKRRPSSQRSALRRSARRLGTWAPRRLHGRSLRRTEAVWGGMGAPQAAQPRGSRPAPTRPKQLMQTRLLLARWRALRRRAAPGRGGACVSRGQGARESRAGIDNPALYLVARSNYLGFPNTSIVVTLVVFAHTDALLCGWRLMAVLFLDRSC